LYADELEFQEKEIEHCSLQEKLDMELKELDKRLEEKEVLFSSLECSSL
jgi:kinesin family protein 4/21/27